MPRERDSLVHEAFVTRFTIVSERGRECERASERTRKRGECYMQRYIYYITCDFFLFYIYQTYLREREDI